MKTQALGIALLLTTALGMPDAAAAPASLLFADGTQWENIEVVEVLPALESGVLRVQIAMPHLSPDGLGPVRAQSLGGGRWIVEPVVQVRMIPALPVSGAATTAGLPITLTQSDLDVLQGPSKPLEQSDSGHIATTPTALEGLISGDKSGAAAQASPVSSLTLADLLNRRYATEDEALSGPFREAETLQALSVEQLLLRDNEGEITLIGSTALGRPRNPPEGSQCRFVLRSLFERVAVRLYADPFHMESGGRKSYHAAIWRNGRWRLVAGILVEEGCANLRLEVPMLPRFRQALIPYSDLPRLDRNSAEVYSRLPVARIVSGTVSDMDGSGKDLLLRVGDTVYRVMGIELREARERREVMRLAEGMVRFQSVDLLLPPHRAGERPEAVVLLDSVDLAGFLFARGATVPRGIMGAYSIHIRKFARP